MQSHNDRFDSCRALAHSQQDVGEGVVVLIDEQIQEIGDELSEGVACGSFAASVGGICPPRSVGGQE